MDSAHWGLLIALIVSVVFWFMTAYTLEKTNKELQAERHMLGQERKHVVSLVQELAEAGDKISRLERNQQDFMESNEARLDAMAMALFESGRLHVSLRKT